LLQRIAALPRGSVARCPRCDALLRRRRTDSIRRSLALGLTGLLLFLLATNLDFISLDVYGRTNDTAFMSGPIQLNLHGMWEIAIVVLITTIAAPAIRLTSLVWVLLGLQLRRPPAGLHVVFRWFENLAPWSMIEVFLLGVFVAYTKLVDLAAVHVGGAVYALAALMLVQVTIDAVLDKEAVWELIAARGQAAGRRGDGGGPATGCDTCGFVTEDRPACPRCGATLRPRKRASIARTWALLAAAAILYIPANVLPVMTFTELGRGDPNTIISGVMELASSGMWPLAALVFFASITVPVLKLLGLSFLLITTHRKSLRGLRQRTWIFRVVESFGRWSMIDVFMISILTALVRLGFIASVYPGPGVIAFCSVVILTMFAAMSFDPRLMWDAAEQARAERPISRSVRVVPAE
jgi:paraquat-inducible protein A